METSTKDMTFDQEEVNYVPLSGKRNQACANCRFFFPSGGCLIVECEPTAIMATGYCDEWRALPEPEDKAEEMIETLEAIEQQLGMSNMMRGEMARKPTVKERLLALVGIKARDEPIGSGFKSVGNGQWVGWFSNNFKDYQNEYFPAKATDEFIARVDRKEVPPPELYFWHVPYRLGEVKSLARVALDDSPNSPSFTVAVGVYDDTPVAKAFEKAMKDRVYPMSHGFHYAPAFKEGGAYHYYNTFEVSPLPPHAPANPYTLFEDRKAMPLIGDEKRKEFVRLLGDDFVKEIETKAETRAKELQAAGVDYKEFKMIDIEAREQLATLTKEVSALTETIKAKMPMEDEEDAAKKKKADSEDSAFKKEVSEAIRTLANSQTEVVKNMKQMAEFMDLTPRRASKSVDTLVAKDDPALQELQKGMSGEKSNEDKVFNAAFGSVLGGFNNGA
jgi:hypothetical protein